jgi:hypothetical protein
MRLTAEEVESGWLKRIQNNYSSRPYIDLVWIPPLLLGMSLLPAHFALWAVLLVLLSSAAFALFSLVCYRRWRAWRGEQKEIQAATQRGMILLSIAHLAVFLLLTAVALYLFAVEITLDILGELVVPLVATILVGSAVVVAIVVARIGRFTRLLFGHIIDPSTLGSFDTKKAATLAASISAAGVLVFFLLRFFFTFDMRTLFVVAYSGLAAVMVLAFDVPLFYQLGLVLLAGGREASVRDRR